MPVLCDAMASVHSCAVASLPPASRAAAVPHRRSRDAPHAARRLSQLPTGGPTVKFAPCNTDGIEIACPWTEEALLTPEQLAAAGSDRSPICCSRLNHRCDVWPLTGGPRCAMCPSICIYTCSPGYACATDPADG